MAFAARRRTPAPEDIDTLNRFAAEYNRYISGLHDGVLDTHQWARVEDAWKKLS